MEKRPKILSIDDNQSNQKLIKKALENEFEITAALSGLDGLEALSSVHPDAILLDVDMPTLNGWQICKMIRTEPEYSQTPILFVSGLTDEIDKIKAFQSGGDGFIDKPVDIQNLKKQLWSFLTRTEESKAQMRASNDVPSLDQNLQHLHDFFMDLLGIQNSQTLGVRILNCLDKMGLKGALTFHEDNQLHSSIGPLSELEKTLLHQATLPYPTEYSARFVWGGEHIGVIIQNMPQTKNEAYRPLTQILHNLFNICNEKLRHLNLLQSQNISAHSDKPLNKTNANQHLNKLERILYKLESVAEIELAEMCEKLQLEINSSNQLPNKTLLNKKLLDHCIKARIAIYDHCLDAQATVNKLESVYP